MNQLYQRRYSLWYERVLFSGIFQFFLGALFVVILPSFQRWPNSFLTINLDAVAFSSSAANAVAFLTAFAVLRRLRHFPGAQTTSYILPTLAIIWLLVIALLFFMRFDYSRQVLMLSYFSANIWALTGFYIRRKYRVQKLALVPVGRALSLHGIKGARMTALQRPSLNGKRFDAVVADLHADGLSDEWERFLARCTLSRIPVFHYKHIMETLTGRVKIDHLSENEFGALLPSPFYEFFKRVMDVSLVIIFLPVWLPLILITGLAIKMESDGPILFKQERIGQGNRSFTVYKLRSMCADSEKEGAKFASANDMRVTRIGKFIRKTRIDELPQFFNVLMGNMSLIGPRPEQRIFADQFESEISFYAYRHVVKPGITGWAQVEQGYAADADDTRVKIEHDFYYIKHFSLWLDLLIIFKTIRTIITGFGAR